MTHRRANRAIVIGGSMAGMCAARVLADVYEHVVVLERDSFPTEATHRRGVPQSHHAHVLLVRGQREIERWFPGFTEAVLSRGGQQLDFAEAFAVRRMWGWAPRSATGFQMLWGSRPLFENVVRERLRGRGNVELRELHAVESLQVTRGERLRVDGVVVKSRGGSAEKLYADLIVDCSGRASQLPRWLEKIGVPTPREEVVEAFAGYASRFYRQPSPEDWPDEWWWKGLWVEGIPPDLPRGGVAFPIEDRCWLVTAVGFMKDYPPTDERRFVEYLESLASPVLARVIEKCEPLSDIVPNRSTTNRFRHYESWSAELDGFVATGDSVCAFNPVYGQGMSTAAVCAAELERALARVGPRPEELPKEHFREQGRFLSGVWNLAIGADFAWPTTEGVRPTASRLFWPYTFLLLESMHGDPEVMRKMAPVFQLLAPPERAMEPAMLRAVASSSLRRRVARFREALSRGQGINAVRAAVLPTMAELGSMPPRENAGANG